MSAHRYLPAAQNIAQVFPHILVEQGLDPMINHYYLTETDRGDAWLFISLEDRASEWIESYAAPKVLTRLSASLHGHLVLFSKLNGLRYAVLLASTTISERLD